MFGSFVSIFYRVMTKVKKTVLLLLFLSARADDTACKPGCFGWCSVTQASSHCSDCHCRACAFCEAAPAAASSSASSMALASGAVSAPLHDCESFCDAAFKRAHCALDKCLACSFCGCDSGIEGDAKKQTCADWCALESATSHCSWCSCQACAFCDAGGGALPPPDQQAAGAAHGVAVGSHQCAPADEQDASVFDCQLFCSPDFRDEHCSRCQCKGCKFCSCTSDHEGDTPHEACSAWCSVDFHKTHCSWCACSACDYCRVGVPCDSFLPDDTRHETCEDFCDEGFAERHCDFCKCRDCDFCAAALIGEREAGKQRAEKAKRESWKRVGLGGAADGASSAASTSLECSSGVAGDGAHRTCESFCSVASSAVHCAMCKCAGCDFCTGRCSSGLLGDTGYASCEPECDHAEAADHCTYCRCQGCTFCSGAGGSGGAASLPAPRGAACSSLAPGDTLYESCEQPGCAEASFADACGSCRCKLCKVCTALGDVAFYI